MIAINPTTTVREVAIENESATRLFEKLGIDYCCGGSQPFAEACTTAGVAVAEVVYRLEQAEQANEARGQLTNWQTEPLTQLITHIHDTHHVFTREEMDRLEPLLAKVCSVYSATHPELLRIEALFQDLQRDLLMHMKKEEQVLFPYILGLEAAISQSYQRPVAPFGTVQNPIRMMMMEHDIAGDILRQMRELSVDYALPTEACTTYKTLYQALEGFEQDLHQHIHLENNILFPRAIEMESAA